MDSLWNVASVRSVWNDFVIHFSIKWFHIWFLLTSVYFTVQLIQISVDVFNVKIKRWSIKSSNFVTDINTPLKIRCQQHSRKYILPDCVGCRTHKPTVWHDSPPDTSDLICPCMNCCVDKRPDHSWLRANRYALLAVDTSSPAEQRVGWHQFDSTATYSKWIECHHDLHFAECIPRKWSSCSGSLFHFLLQILGEIRRVWIGEMGFKGWFCAKREKCDCWFSFLFLFYSVTHSHDYKNLSNYTYPNEKTDCLSISYYRYFSNFVQTLHKNNIFSIETDHKMMI